MGCCGSKDAKQERKRQRTVRKYSTRVANSLVSTALSDAVSEIVRTESVKRQQESKAGVEVEHEEMNKRSTSAISKKPKSKKKSKKKTNSKNDKNDKNDNGKSKKKSQRKAAGKAPQQPAQEQGEGQGEQRKFRRRFSTVGSSNDAGGLAADSEDDGEWIILTDDDDRRIRAVHEKNPLFSRYELQRVFAAVKENGGSLGREEFAMVYVTYAQLHDHNMALRVFDLLDANHDNEVSFEEFVPFLEVMLHGTREDRAKFCFQLYDRDNKGEFSKESFATFLSKLPVDHIMEDFQLTRPGTRVFSEHNSLPSLAEEEDESESGELVADEQWHRAQEEKAKKAEDERVRKEMIKSFRRSRGELLENDDDEDSSHQSHAGANSTRQHTKDKLNEAKAKEVADKVFEELGQERNTITLEEFTSRINTSQTLRAFFPF